MLVTRVQEITSPDRVGSVRIMVMAKPDPNEPVRPTRPNLWLMLFEGLMVGLILGTCIALVDPRIRSAEEVVAATTLPIVGVVPHMRRSPSLQTRGRKVHLDPMSDVSEAFRSIRSAVFFGPKGKAVLITSPMRGEGKSTTAANLSIAMAEAGQRVLLVDADLREPMQHKIFGVDNDSGVASVIAGRGSVDRAIQTTGIRGLDLLPCGPIPYNPSETINNQAFADLLVELSRRYDYVIVDSPPVLAVTDARILAAMCELALLIVRAEKSHKRATQDARDGLLGFGATIVGVVINDGPRNQHRYGYYGGYGHQETPPVANFVRYTTVERTDSIADDLAMTRR
jgi:capsular exopolysaccharide synthesis family protein